MQSTYIGGIPVKPMVKPNMRIRMSCVSMYLQMQFKGKLLVSFPPPQQMIRQAGILLRISLISNELWVKQKARAHTSPLVLDKLNHRELSRSTAFEFETHTNARKLTNYSQRTACPTENWYDKLLSLSLSLTGQAFNSSVWTASSLDWNRRKKRAIDSSSINATSAAPLDSRLRHTFSSI